MNILFLSNVLPYPLDAGPKVRSYYVLRYLAQNHRVTLVTFTRNADSADAIRHLESFCHAVHGVPIRRSRLQDAIHLARSFVTARPFLILRDDLRAMDEKIRAVAQTNAFDTVHADQLSTAHYALRVKNVRRVLDQHNAVWTITRRLAGQQTSRVQRNLLEREARLVREYEAVTCAQFDHVVTVTDEDKCALTFPEHPPRSPIPTIPICIDPQETTPIAFNPTARDVICIGGMFYPPNVDGVMWFARQVLPRVWEQSPATKFFIVGARPAAVLRALAQNEPRLVVTDYVRDTSVYLQQAAAFVVPLRAGGGMRVKILDAWARGVPMVSTTIGAEGIEYQGNENILIADSPDNFAKAVLHLIQDRAFAETLARNGRGWVHAKYAWRQVYRAWDTVYP